MHVAGMGQPDAVESGYGSDRTGLVWAFRFAPGEPAHAVQPGEMADLVLGGSATPGGQFPWLHFSLSNAASERWLRQHLELPNSFHLLLHESVGSTRVEQDGESLLAIIHDVLFDSSFDTTDVSTVALCMQPRVLVSARPRPLRSLDRLLVSRPRAGDPNAERGPLCRTQAPRGRAADGVGWRGGLSPVSSGPS